MKLARPVPQRVGLGYDERHRAGKAAGRAEREAGMSRRYRVLLMASIGMALVGVLHASAQNSAKLTGELFIAGKTPLDPPPEEPKNTHAYVTIDGAAALQMYRSMRAKAEKDLCQEGNMIKRAGPLACSLARNGKAATCDYAIDLVNGALADGRPC